MNALLVTFLVSIASAGAPMGEARPEMDRGTADFIAAETGLGMKSAFDGVRGSDPAARKQLMRYLDKRGARPLILELQRERIRVTQNCRNNRRVMQADCDKEVARIDAARNAFAKAALEKSGDAAAQRARVSLAAHVYHHQILAETLQKRFQKKGAGSQEHIQAAGMAAGMIASLAAMNAEAQGEGRVPASAGGSDASRLEADLEQMLAPLSAK